MDWKSIDLVVFITMLLCCTGNTFYAFEGGHDISLYQQIVQGVKYSVVKLQRNIFKIRFKNYSELFQRL